jgi:predicted transposase YbfD/YdcC
VACLDKWSGEEWHGSIGFMEEIAMPSLPKSQTNSPPTLRECFLDLPDPRREHGRLHGLWDIVGLTICAMICGCNEVVEIENYGQRKIDFLRTFLDLENGVPSHDTIGRVFARLQPQAFRECFAAWVEGLARTIQEATGRHIAIDGKTLRRSHGPEVKPLHLVSAFAVENRLVLTQQAVDGKSNEITAIPELLKLLDVRKAVITIDAMGCQKEIAAQIKEQGGDYVLSLKDNQPSLHQEVSALFEKGLETNFQGMKHQQWSTTDDAHGRHEQRTYYMLQPSKAWLAQHPEWKGLKTLGMVYSERQVKGQPATSEARLYISSLTLNVIALARAIRNHWAIENRLHWILDVSYREDDNRSRKDHTAENLAWIRRVTAGLLAKDPTKVGITCKRKMAGWDDAMLLRIAGHAVA